MSKPCDALKFSTKSEQDEYWAMRPLKQKMQPNEIVTKSYSPDVVPQVKLIVNNDERKNNIAYIPPKVRNHDLENYAHPFNMFDYLGHYCAKKINQIVYLKFFNNKYNMMADCKQKTRAMAGFFVPFQQIYSETQHNFTKNLGLKFPLKDPQAQLPAQKNNKGCAFDPLFCSQYEGSNLFAVIRNSPFDYELILQNDVNSCAQVGWFNFSVEFMSQGYYSFCIKNMTKHMTKVFKRGFRINYCFLNNLNDSVRNETLDDWNPIGNNVKYVQNNIEIENQPGEYYYDLYFEYRCKNKKEIVAFALDKPYTALEAKNYFSEVAPKKLRGLTKIQKVQYGKTIEGTPLVAYHIKKRRAGSDLNMLSPKNIEGQSPTNRSSQNISSLPNTLNTPELKHRTVFILARMSGQDVSGSSIIEGMVDFLLDTMEFDALKRTINFYFVPMVNPDSVKYGNSLTNLTGSNLYDCWKNPHRIYQAEIYHLKNFMAEINKDSPVSHVFNFASEYQEIYSSVIGTKNEGEECEDSKIFPFVMSKRHHMISFADCYFHEKNSSNSMSCVLTEMFPQVLAYEFKISRFQFEKEPEQGSEIIELASANLRQCRPQGYSNFGKRFMEDFLEHIKIYDKNSLLKNKWLRDIEEIEELKPKDEPIIITQRPVEERFPQRFYTIKNVQPTPAKSVKKSPKRFDGKALSRRGQRSLDKTNQNVLDSPFLNEHRNMLVRFCFADLNKKKKQFEQRVEHMDENLRQTLGKAGNSTVNEKILPQFRIKQKTHEVLKNCSSNMMNFEMGIVSQQKLKKQTNSPYVSSEKQKLKRKEMSLKKLKRIRNNDSTRGLNQDRSLVFLKP